MAPTTAGPPLTADCIYILYNLSERLNKNVEVAVEDASFDEASLFPSPIRHVGIDVGAAHFHVSHSSLFFFVARSTSSIFQAKGHEVHTLSLGC